jgi:excisionase family DNA binding protein
MAIQLMTIKDVCSKTRLSRSTVYKMVEERKIPHVRLHGNIRFDEQKIDNWIMLREVKQKSFV